MFSAKVTERSFYPILIKCIQMQEGSGVSEVLYESEPDIEACIYGKKWIVSVKIGDDPRTARNALLQYLKHKEDTGIQNGIIIFLPEIIRKTRVREDELDSAIEKTELTAIIDSPSYKAEIKDTFSSILNKIKIATIEKETKDHLPLDRIVNILQYHLSEMMSTIKLSNEKIVEIVTDRELLMDLGQIEERNAEPVARFLAAYIYISQIIFLRMLYTNSNIIDVKITRPIERPFLRTIFRRILEIDYKHIFGTDVLDSIDDRYLEETFNLIWGLEVEKVRYELSGRIFHDLMPPEIRKLTAAFYTRPLAAELMCKLAIDDYIDTILDPACGSGTILTAAYKRKLELWKQSRISSNPHKRFCENEIFGFDIMPFAVHLTSANLAALEPGEILSRTQIIHGDSLDLDANTIEAAGIAQNLFPTAKGDSSSGRSSQVFIEPVDVLVMNPPFTKMERGVKRFVNIHKYANIVGKEVGLWGHFIGLAQQFVKNGGKLGAVIPINILRGRESKKVREFIFNNWTPQFILKPSVNYAFSESSEYRDIIVIARKGISNLGDRVKFCIIKECLSNLDENRVNEIASLIETKEYLRENSYVDIDTYGITEIRNRLDSLMWYIGGSNFDNRDVLVNFINRTTGVLNRIDADQLKSGYRPSKNVSSFMFLTRAMNGARTEEAYLRFTKENDEYVICTSRFSGKQYNIEKTSFKPSLRTPVGIKSYDVTDNWDYIAKEKYNNIGEIFEACGLDEANYKYDYWVKVKREIKSVETDIAIARRINPYSPATSLVSFYSDIPISPSDQFNIITASDKEFAKAQCVILNSVIFFSQFFLMKEESTGRYIDIRLYDLLEYNLAPKKQHVTLLAQVFDRYRTIEFPSIGEQFNANYESLYQDHKENRKRPGQYKLFSSPTRDSFPAPERLDFDKAVCKALGIEIDEEELRKIYSVLSKEMMITRGLRRD